MKQRWLLYVWMVLGVSALSCSVRADDNRAATLGEETRRQDGALGESAAAESTSDLPKAENVDLKEVLSEPINAKLPVPQVEESVSQPQEGSAAADVSVSSSEAATESAAVSSPASGVQEGDLTKSTEADVEGDRAPGISADESAPADTEEQAADQSRTFRLLGAEVEPGTSTRLAWAAKESLAGISVPTPVLVVHGANPGPVVCLTAAVHGDELNGIEIVRQVLYDLEAAKLSGTVVGVPIVNLQGFRRASRYLPDRRDLNRYFPGNPAGSSASRIAHSFFTGVVQHCDYLIDLHTGSFRRTNLPQLRADLNDQRVAQMTENMGPIVVLQSRGARGSLRRAAVDADVIAVTVEAGEPLHVDFDAVKQGVRSVETFLDKIGAYNKKGLWARKTKPVYVKSRWVRSASGGILYSQVTLGERVTQGQQLGTVTDPITNEATPIESPSDGQVIGMALNQVMLPGYAAYHIGFQATVAEAASKDVGPDESAGDDPADEESEEEESAY